MATLKIAATLFGIALFCLALVGGVGPCGPSTELGFLLLLAGFPLALVGWGACLVGLVRVLIQGPYESLMISLLLATPLVIVVTAGLALAKSDPGMMLFGVLFWPWCVALGVLIDDWRRSWR